MCLVCFVLNDIQKAVKCAFVSPGMTAVVKTLNARCLVFWNGFYKDAKTRVLIADLSPCSQRCVLVLTNLWTVKSEMHKKMCSHSFSSLYHNLTFSIWYPHEIPHDLVRKGDKNICQVPSILNEMMIMINNRLFRPRAAFTVFSFDGCHLARFMQSLILAQV